MKLRRGGCGRHTLAVFECQGFSVWLVLVSGSENVFSSSGAPFLLCGSN